MLIPTFDLTHVSEYRICFCKWVRVLQWFVCVSVLTVRAETPRSTLLCAFHSQHIGQHTAGTPFKRKGNLEEQTQE